MRIWERGRADDEKGRVEVSPPRGPIELGKALTLSVAVCTVLITLAVGLPLGVTMGGTSPTASGWGCSPPCGDALSSG
jgi:hypothetical protein